MAYLRDYQQRSIDAIRTELKKGHKKIVLQLPTGSGKSVIMAEIIESALAKNRRIFVLVRRRVIVTQLSKRFGAQVMMAGQRPDKNAQIIVASIDTAKRRKLSDYGFFDFVLVTRHTTPRRATIKMF